LDTCKGILNIEYARGRKTGKALQYRLRRRTSEVILSIKKHHPTGIRAMLDIGTADGLMLSCIKKEFPESHCIGLEYSEDLIAVNDDKMIEIIRGDALDLPFNNDHFEVVVAAAVIEHVPNPQQMLKETYRVLSEGGIFILTAPDPFWEHLATAVGHLGKDLHNNVMNLRELQAVFNDTNFTLLESKKFMLSPIGMPLEYTVEKIVRGLGLNFLFANQLVVGRKRCPKSRRA